MQSKVWSKTGAGLGRDPHGDEIIEKYATENEVVTVTRYKRYIEHYNAPLQVKYSKVAYERLHNHH